MKDSKFFFIVCNISYNSYVKITKNRLNLLFHFQRPTRFKNLPEPCQERLEKIAGEQRLPFPEVRARLEARRKQQEEAADVVVVVGEGSSSSSKKGGSRSRKKKGKGKREEEERKQKSAGGTHVIVLKGPGQH